MRAARRSRPSTSDSVPAQPRNEANGAAKEETNVDPPPKDLIGQPQVEQVVAVSQRQPAENAADAAESTSVPQTRELELKPIEQRKPESPLSQQQRRKRAAENIEKISQALMKYHEQNKIFPRAFSKSASGIPTLSWRVELLPYLGYEELYKRFDLDTPWNREPNQSLLQFIPDEFVSPERFDTSTNYQVPAYRTFLFADNRARAQHNIEDGAGNTVMLLEVNDELAVPWTQPTDYDPQNVRRLTDDLGGLREDGTFAAWANGWTVLLARELSNDQLLNSLTYESGDGQVAGAVHRDISIDGISDAAVASTSDRDAPSNSENAIKSPAAKPIEVTRVRAPVPIAAEIAAAKDVLRRVYTEKIKDASDDETKTRLATEMLDQAAKMENDRPGAYALQSAAMQLAMDAGDPSTLIAAIDNRVAVFEVDAYEENVVNLIALGQHTVSRDPDTVEGDELLERSTRVIYAGIEDNDFMRASAVARIAYRYTGQERKEEIPKLLSRLRVLLGTAKREYDASVDHLRAYREDPSNVQAGASFGMFLCMIKGDWQHGLPLLTQAGPAALQEVARLDIAGAQTNQARVALGDAWWDLSEVARTGAYRQAARDRAVFWYEQAFDSLPDSLDRMHVKSRMDEAEAIDGTSPIALCVQLADELGVDLSYGLAAIADTGQRKLGAKKLSGRDEYD